MSHLQEQGERQMSRGSFILKGSGGTDGLRQKEHAERRLGFNLDH